MGRPLEQKVVTTIKPRIPEGLVQVYLREFEVFRREKESEGLSVNQTDFLNSIVMKFLKDKESLK